MATKRRSRWCDCADKVNEELRKQGEELDASFLVVGRTLRLIPRIAKLRLEGAPRRRVPRCTLLPNYCPFCGVEYPRMERK